jgi:CRISPR-associated protein Csm2
MTLTETNYVDHAEQVIQSLIAKDNKYGNQRMPMTTSQIRNILSMTAELYTDAKHTLGETLSPQQQGQVQYLRMRIAYEAGRDPRGVKAFVEKAELLTNLSQIGSSKSRLLLFCRYMEALVAYHRYYGGKD